MIKKKIKTRKNTKSKIYHNEKRKNAGEEWVDSVMKLTFVQET